MKLGKIMLPVIFLPALMLLFIGCAQEEYGPRKTVQECWSAIKQGDKDKASSFYVADFEGMIMLEHFWNPIEGWGVDPEIDEAFIGRIDVEVNDQDINGDHAVVQVFVHWPDMQQLSNMFMEDAVMLASGLKIGGAGQRQIQEVLEEAFIHYLEKTPDVKTDHEIHLKNVQEQWKLTTELLPNFRKGLDANISDYSD